MQAFIRSGAFGAFATFLLGSAVACTHERVVSTRYSPQVLVAVPPGSICPHGEVVGVEASNRTADPGSAGTTEAGIHTFHYRFDADPAYALKRGLEESLQAGGCRLDGTSAANLFVHILKIEARGEKCGFVSCSGTGAATVSVTMSDRAGHPLFKQDLASAATRSCGMVICNEEEASALAEQILTDTIRRTVQTFATAITKQLAKATPTVPAPTTAPSAPTTPSAPAAAPTAAPTS